MNSDNVLTRKTHSCGIAEPLLPLALLYDRCITTINPPPSPASSFIPCLFVVHYPHLSICPVQVHVPSIFFEKPSWLPSIWSIYNKQLNALTFLSWDHPGSFPPLSLPAVLGLEPSFATYWLPNPGSRGIFLLGRREGERQRETERDRCVCVYTRVRVGDPSIAHTCAP